MAPRKKTHGVGAVVSVLTKFVHPSQLIRDAPNLHGGDVDDIALAEQSFLFFVGIDHGEHSECSLLLCNLPKVDALTARKLIAQQRIENKYLDKEVRENNWRKRRADEHKLITLPNYKKFRNSCVVTCKSKYQKWICSCRAHRVRSYCSCSPGIIQCVE